MSTSPEKESVAAITPQCASRKVVQVEGEFSIDSIEVLEDRSPEMAVNAHITVHVEGSGKPIYGSLPD